MAYKVFQWASGGVGKQTARAAIARESLELVGLHVYSADKVGKDVGQLIDHPDTGITATGDIDAVIHSDADIVIHTPLPSLVYGDNPDQDLEDICALLRAGKNVITVVGYMYPKVHGETVVSRLQEACQAGYPANTPVVLCGLRPAGSGLGSLPIVPAVEGRPRWKTAPDRNEAKSVAAKFR